MQEMVIILRISRDLPLNSSLSCFDEICHFPSRSVSLICTLSSDLSGAIDGPETARLSLSLTEANQEKIGDRK